MSSNTAARAARRLRTLLLGGSALCAVVVAGFLGSADAAGLPTQGGVDLSVVGSGTINAKTLVGGVVTAGTVNYATINGGSGNRTANVTLAAPRTIIDWTTFTVANNRILNFDFAAASDIVINRVATGNAINVNTGGAVNGKVGAATGGNIWFLADGGVFINGTVTANGVLASNNINVVNLNLLQDPVASLKATELAAASSLIDISGAGSATGAQIGANGDITLSGAVDAGSSGTVDLISQTATKPGVIAETGGGLINAATLIGTSVGGTTLNGTNTIANLGAFANTGAGGFALTNNQALNVNGAVSAGTSGDLVLITTIGNLTLGAALNAAAGNQVNLTSAGAIAGNAATITAGTLTGSSVGGASLNNAANQVAAFNGFANTGGGAVVLKDGQALSVGGLTTSGAGGNATLTTTVGALTLTGAIDVGANTLTTTSAASVAGDAATVTAGTLSGSSVGGASFNNGGNTITNLGVFANTGAGGFALTDSQALNVSGTVNAGNGGGLSLVTTTGGMTLAGGLTTAVADTISLSSAGAIIQNSGVITTGTLTGSATGGATLNDANLITNLGAFANSGAGGFALTNAQALGVTGVVNAGSGGNLTVRTTVGDLGVAASGAVTASGASLVTLNSAGALTETAGGAITTGRDLTLIASTTINLATAPAVSRDYSVTAQTFSGAELAVTAGRDFTVNSLAPGGLTLSNTQNFSATRNLTVTSAGALNTSAATLTATGGALTLQSGGGGNLTFGALGAAGNLVTLTSAGILSQGAGIITAATLTGSSVGGATLGGANVIANLGAFANAGAGTINFNDTVAFDITGVVNPGAGATLNLVSIGALTETGAGALVATTFTGSSSGGATLRGANQITNLGAFTNTGAGGLDLKNNAALTVTGAVNATTVNLDSTTSLAEAGGVITATTFSGSTVGGATLTGTNAITNLGAFTGGGLNLNNGGALTVAGPVNAATVNLTSGGVLSEAGGVITTTTFTGGSVGGATLNGANAIINLGAFANSGAGGLVLTNAQALNVSGTVNAATVTLTSAGAITESNGAAILTGTLTGSSVGGAAFGSGLNQIAAFTGFTNTVSGDVAVNDAVDVTATVANPVGSVSLTSAGSVSQGVGVITSGADLILSAGAAINLTAAPNVMRDYGVTALIFGGLTLSGTAGRDFTVNSLAPLTLTPAQSFTANRNLTVTSTALLDTSLAALMATGGTLNLRGGNGLNIGATVATAGATTFASTAGDIALNGAVNAAGQTLTFMSAGMVNQSGGSSINAATLTGSSVGQTALGTVSNNIGAIGDYTVTGGFFGIEDSAPNLTINGLLSAAGDTVFLLNNGAGNIITQAPASVITAATLNATSPGGVSLTGQNRVATLAQFDNGGGGDLLLTNAQGLAVTGAINAGAGNLTLTTTNGGALALNAGLSAAMVNLNAAGAITQAPASAITTGLLTGTSVGGATLNSANLIINLGAFANTGGGGFALTNNQALSVGGPVDAGAGGALTLITTIGGQTLNGALGGTGETVNLVSAGTITQASGAITGALTGSSVGNASLTGANTIDQLGPFTVAGGGVLSLSDIVPNLDITGSVTDLGGAVVLSNTGAAGTITQTTGVITAGSLGASSTAGVILSGANLVNILTNLSNSGAGDLVFTDTTSLTINGLVSAGNGNIVLTTAGAGSDLTVTGALFTSAAFSVTLNSAAQINESAGAITTGALTGSSVNGATLTGANTVANLGTFTNSGAATTISFNDTAAAGFNIIGVVNPGAGNDLSLNSLGALNETGAGAIIANAFSGSSSGGAALTGPNQIAALNSFTTNGGNLTLNDTANLVVQGAVNAGAGTVALTDAGTITQTAGTITAATLTGSSNGGALFEGGNQIVNLGPFANSGGNLGGFGLVVIDNQALNVSGAVNGGAGNALGFETFAGGISLNGPVTAVGAAVELFSAAGVSQSASITAATLLGSSNGSTILNDPLNQIGSLGGAGVGGVSGFSTSGGNFSLTDAANLTLQNAIDVGAGTVSLIGAGTITQDPASVITAGLLTGSSADGANFDGANLITDLGAFTNSGAGAFSLTNAQTLTVTGGVDAGTGPLTLTTIGALSDLTLNTALSALGQTVTLTSAGTISQGAADIITAATLTGSSVGGTTLAGANAVTTLGNFANIGAGGFSFTNARTLNVTGLIAAGTGNLALTTTGGGSNLLLSTGLTAPIVTLNSAGTIAANVATITAPILTGSSVGGASFNNAANLVGALNGFTNTGGGAVALTNGQALSVNGLADGGGDATLTVAVGGLTLTGAINLGGVHTLTTISAGTIAADTATITAGVLTGSSVGGASFNNAANLIGVFNGFTNTGGGGVVLTDGESLNVGGLTNIGGDATLATDVGGLTLTGAINLGAANTLTATSAAGVAAGGANITAGTLSGASNGGAIFAGSNHIGVLNGFTTANGNLTLVDAANLTAQGAVNTGTGMLTFTDSGTIAADAATITTGILTWSSVGGASFNNAGNLIGALGGFTNTGGAVAVTDGEALTVNGLTNLGGDASFTTTVGGLTLTGALNVGGASLITHSAGTISADAATITAGSLTGASVGIASFSNAANQIGALGAFTTSNGNLTVGNSGALVVRGAINAGSATVTLTDAGTITQDAASVITAGALTGSSNGGTSLTGANQFDSLAGFTNTGAGGLAVTDAKASGMTITTAVDAGVSNLTLTTLNGGLLTLRANLTTGPGQVNLVSSGPIIQAAGAIAAGVLTGSSVGGATLNDANMIGALGSFSNTGSGGFSLTDAQALNLLAGVTVNAGPGALALTTTAGDITAAAANSLVAGSDVLITAAGAARIDAATAGGDVAVQSTGGDVTVASATAGDDVVIVSPGLVTLNGPVGTTGGADVAGAGDTLFSTVSAPLNGLFKLDGQSAVFISAKTYANAGGALTAHDAVGISLSDTAGMILASAAGTGSTVIAATLQSPSVVLFESGGNITIGDAALPSQLSKAISFYTSGTVSVTGRFVPFADKTVALTIGGPAASGWTPSLIQIVNDSDAGQAGPNHGSIGTATLASATGPVSGAVTFQSATLTTSGNILMGSTQYDQTLNTTTAPPAEINPTIPRPPLPVNTSHTVLFAVGNADLYSDKRILQQNTGGFQATQSTGIYLTGTLTVHGYQTGGPQNLDLFAAITNPGGGLLTGPTASVSGRIVVSPGNPTFRALYRVNSCVVGQQGNCTPTANPVVTVKPDDLLTDVLPKQVERQDVEDPTITGAPNEEIWRKPE